MTEIEQTSYYATDWLGKRAGLTPDRIGLVEGPGGPEVTYGRWNERVNRTANYLRALGVERGDRVAVYASNCPEYLDLFWAAGKLGAVLQNLNWRLTVRELEGIVAAGEPTLLAYGPEWRSQVDELRPTLTTVREVVALDDPGPGDRAFAERESHSEALDDPPDLTLDDPWGIYYTGGTTGLPKGAVLTHGNITWNSVNTIVSWGLHAGH